MQNRFQGLLRLAIILLAQVASASVALALRGKLPRLALILLARVRTLPLARAVAVAAALGCPAGAIAQAITEFNIPTTVSSDPFSVIAGSDGALWFTERFANKIGRIDTSGNITEFAVPTAVSFPQVITAGPDGALWFTETYVSQIGRIDTSGNITEFALPDPAGGLGFITTGPDGALWFTENTSKDWTDHDRGCCD
jgi:streptogramin lyase